MYRTHGSKILSVCVIAITLLCALMIKADFLVESYFDYHNSVTESSYEPADMEQVRAGRLRLIELRRSPQVIAITIKYRCVSEKHLCFMTLLLQS